MTLRAGLDVAYAALCPACHHKALTGESQLVAQNPLAREEHFRRLNIAVCADCEERELARRFQRAALGSAPVEQFLKTIASKLSDEVRLWERSGNPNYQQAFIDSCHRRVEFILSDELGMARIQSMRVSLSYESWITVSIPNGDGEVVGHLHIGVNPVWWEVLGWEWKRYAHREEP